MKISKQITEQLMAPIEKPPVPQVMWREIEKKYNIDFLKSYYQFFQIVDLLITNKIHQDLTKEARLHYVFDMARAVVQEEGKTGRIWNGCLPKEWLDQWRKKILIPKPKDLYYKYSKQQKQIEKNHETIVEECKKQEIIIEEQQQKIYKLLDDLQELQVKYQDLEDRHTIEKMKNKQETENLQQKAQRWIDIAERLERYKEQSTQMEKRDIQIEKEEEGQLKTIEKLDQSIQIEDEDFEMDAYDINQTQTQRFNRRRYFAKWLDENKILGKKNLIERWKKMRNKYWNIDCLGKSDLQKDLIINKKGWLQFSDEYKKCYKSCIILQWKGWTYAIKIRKINFVNKKYIIEKKKIHKESQEEWQELDDFDEIYF